MKIGKSPTLQEHCNLVDADCKSTFSSATLHFYMNQLMENIKILYGSADSKLLRSNQKSSLQWKKPELLKVNSKTELILCRELICVPKIGFDDLGALSHLSDSVRHCCIQGFPALWSSWNTWKREFPGTW